MAEQIFCLSRLEPSEDMLQLVQVAYDCFPPMVREMFMGCKSEADLPRLAQHYLKEIREDPFTVWLKVVDRASGKIVAGSQWKVFPSFSPASADDKPAEWLEGEDLTKATQILEKMNAARRAANPKGYVRESSPHLLHPSQLQKERRWRNDDELGMQCGGCSNVAVLD
ncbi:hypothetical protein KC338_g187 [Hortaea werneckii]|nr:hypothetical protein KC338_g187 [Hortaea werneckii]